MQCAQVCNCQKGRAIQLALPRQFEIQMSPNEGGGDDNLPQRGGERRGICYTKDRQTFRVGGHIGKIWGFGGPQLPDIFCITLFLLTNFVQSSYFSFKVMIILDTFDHVREASGRIRGLGGPYAARGPQFADPCATPKTASSSPLSKSSASPVIPGVQVEELFNEPIVHILLRLLVHWTLTKHKTHS